MKCSMPGVSIPLYTTAEGNLLEIDNNNNVIASNKVTGFSNKSTI